MSTAAEPQFLIRLLGGICVCGAGGVEAEVRSRAAALLLGRLAAPSVVAQRREALIDALFPEQAPESGRARLRQALYLLRQELEPLGVAGVALLLADRESIRLATGGMATDVGEFLSHLQRADRSPAAERTRLLSAAVAAYGGEFLPGHYDDWTVRERERLREAYAGALCALADELVRAGDPAPAIDHARRAVQVDPLREESHRGLMEALAAAGRSADAERQYRELERLLREELDLPPGAPTRELRDRIRRSAVDPVQPRPLETADSPTRLPRPVSRFCGRTEEIARAERLLAGDAAPGAAPNPLITLTGPGGSGKSRLALEIAHRLEGWFDGGVWFVPLASVPTASGFLDAVSDAMGLRRPVQPMEALATHLRRGRGALLVLDNFEHLVEGAALLLQELRTRVPGLACLVTSRQRLNLRGEQELRVDPLPLPGTLPAELERLAGYAAVQLFVDRAQAARPDFTLTPENALAVTELCRRLDGIPLALELGAAWLAVLAPEQALDRLERGIAPPASRDQDTPERHRSLQAALDSSYHLLSEEHRWFFRRFSVFRNGWTLEAVAAVCADGGGEAGVLEALTLLAERSLVRVEERRGVLRYRCLEILRRYAADRAAEGGETDAAGSAHAEFFYRQATSLRPQVGESGLADAAMEADFENCRAALSWLSAREEAHEQALELAAALGFYCFVRGRMAEGRQLVRQALNCVPPAPTRGRLAALRSAALLARMQGKSEEAQELLLAARPIAEVLEDRRAAFQVAHDLANVAFDRDDLSGAETWLRECEQINEAYCDPLFDLLIAYRAGCLADRAGETVRAREHLERCVLLARRQQAQRNLGDALCALGWTYRADEPALGVELLRESAGIHREIGHSPMEMQALLYMGGLELVSGAPAAARGSFARALTVGRDLFHGSLTGTALAGIAAAAAAEDQWERAALLFGAADAPSRLPPDGGFNGLPVIAALRARCVRECRDEYRKGAELSLEDAVRIALEAEERTMT